MSFWALLTASSCTPEKLECLLVEKARVSWFDIIIVELILGRLYRQAFAKDSAAAISQLEQLGNKLPIIYASKRPKYEQTKKYK